MREEGNEKTGFKESMPVLISYKKKPWPKDKSDPIQIEKVIPIWRDKLPVTFPSLLSSVCSEGYCSSKASF